LLFNKFIVLGVLIGLGSILTFVLKYQKSARWMTLVGAIVSIGFIFGVDYAFNNLLQPHQQERINVLLGKEVDIKGAGYNIHQSLIAIGSGGLNGKGFLEGTQTKFDFVPEQTTDFIFCTVGEEYGWIGSAALILVYTWLLLRIVLSAESQKARFARIYGYGVASILFLHFAINIGMTIGLLPVVGIPLPLFSYGGSSLLGFTFLIFIYLNLDASQRTYFV
jgi:rod shape determining protein RodA